MMDVKFKAYLYGENKINDVLSIDVNKELVNIVDENGNIITFSKPELNDKVKILPFTGLSRFLGKYKCRITGNYNLK